MFNGILNDLKDSFSNNVENQSIGIGGITVGARVREVISLNKDAPDVPLEDGSVAQDHLIRQPIQIVIEGYVGDIDYKPSPAVSEFLRIQRQVGIIDSYLPLRTQSQIDKVNSLALSAMDAYKQAEAAVKAGEQVFEIFKPSSSKPLIDQFFKAMTDLYNSDILIDIQIGFGIYKNMAVIGTSFPRDVNADKGLLYSITCKQILFAKTVYSKVQPLAQNPSSDINGQAEGVVNKGLNEGSEPNQSLLSKVGAIF